MNTIPNSASDYNLPTPLNASYKKKETESPTTVATGSFDGGDTTSPAVSIQEVAITKSILKKRSAYTAMRRNGKVPTDTPSRSLTFSDKTKKHDGGEKPKYLPKTNQQDVVDTNQTSRPRSKSAPPAYIPPEPTSDIDAHIEKAFSDAGNFITDGLRKVASAASKAGTAAVEFVKKPEDFFLPDLSKQNQTQKKNNQK